MFLKNQTQLPEK